MPVNEEVLRKEIRQDLESSLSMHRASAEGTDEDSRAFARGQAMSHVLFRINQQFGKRVGALSSMFGNKIQKLQEEFGIEVVPLAYLPDGEAEQAFVEYVLYSRFGSETKPNTELIENAIQKGLDANQIRRRCCKLHVNTVSAGNDLLSSAQQRAQPDAHTSRRLALRWAL